MPETNVPPSIPSPSPLDQAKQALATIVIMFKKNPLLASIITKASTFWQRFGSKVKRGLIIFSVFILVIVAIRIGLNLAGVYRPAQISPAVLPGLTPTPTTLYESELLDLQKEVKKFNTLLPDPAPPPVDPDISL